MPNIFRPGGLARDPLYCYHLSERLGLLLLSIQKNACTTQKAWLLRAEGVPVRGDLHQLAFARLSLLNRAPEVRTRALTGLPLLVFLRDPLLRLASAFRDKLVRPLSFPSATAIEGAAARNGVEIVRDRTVPFPSMGDGALFAGCSRVDYERGLTFREFVEYVAATPDLELDPHWRSQSWFLGPALARTRLPNPPQTILLPMGQVAPVLAELGRSTGLAPPERQRPASDELAASSEDLSGVPSGDLQRAARMPAVADLYPDDLIEKVLQRFATDARLWESLGLPSAAAGLRRPPGIAAA